MSGPLLDRIDLHLAVQPVPFDDLALPATGPCTAELRKQVIAAREKQTRRLERAGLRSGAHHNAAIPVASLDELVAATPDASRILSRAVDRMALSARAAHRLMRVARTIADLADEEKVGPGVMAEAVGFRAEQSDPARA